MLVVAYTERQRIDLELLKPIIERNAVYAGLWCIRYLEGKWCFGKAKGTHP